MIKKQKQLEPQKQKKPATVVPKIFITAAIAAQMFSLNTGTLANLRSKKQGPKYYHIGRRAYYKLAEFEQWATGNPVITTDSLPSCQCEGACHD